jgi:hypothetical protein
MSVPGAADADAAGEDAWVAAADVEAAAEVAAADELLLLLPAELQAAASRTAASAASIPSRRTRGGNGRLARLPAPPGLSLLAVICCPPRLHCL